MDKLSLTRFTTILLAVLFISSLHAQDPDIIQESGAETTVERKNGLRIFIDCARCDMNFIREEIPYVNYVRDVKEAQLYILETREQTGSGGNKYTFVFT